MWHQPRLLLATADTLFAVGAVLLAGAAVLWLTRQAVLPITRVVVVSPLVEVQRADLEQALQGVRGNLISVSVGRVQASLEQLPWVRRADVRRRWPGTLEVRLEEQVPVASWGEGAQQLVNRFGEVFYATGSDRTARLPVLNGPLGSAPELLGQMNAFAEVLEPTGRRPAVVTLTNRLAWQLRLDNGLWLELGREQAKSPIRERLARFVDSYANAVVGRSPAPILADLRYPNGFVLRSTGQTPARSHS